MDSVDTDNIQRLSAVQKVEEERPPGNQSTQLIELCRDIFLFHSPDGEAFGSFAVKGHQETHSIRRSSFRDWIRSEYFRTTGKAPSSQPLQDALGVLEARALFEGEEKRVGVRFLEDNDAIYLDLGTPTWEAVKIVAGAWEIVPCGNRFRRPAGMEALPYPQRHGDVLPLKSLVNLANEDDWLLLVGFVLGSFRPNGPFPILSLQGEQGSAKSTTARMIRSIIDPNRAPLRATPKNIDDLMIAAKNGWLLVFDNLSYIPEWMSDAFCRLATGGGFSTRRLYENDEEVLFNTCRPLVLNGIEEFVVRSDLADRTLSLNLPTIGGGQRRTEREIWQTWDASLPLILGGFCDLCSEALRHIDSANFRDLPRMADFVRWVSSVHAVAGWKEDAFSNAFVANKEIAHQSILESSLLTPLIRELASYRWEGTPTQLYERAKAQLSEGNITGFPRSPKALSDHLRRLAPNFRASGILITFSRSSLRRIEIRKLPKLCDDCDNSDVRDESAPRFPVAHDPAVAEKVSESQITEDVEERRAIMAEGLNV